MPSKNVLLQKIGSVAQQLGTTVRTLRFYEEQGLLLPARTTKGTRLYSKDDVARFEVILRLTNLGVPLKEIAQIAFARQESGNGDEASHKVATLLDELRAEAAQKRRMYQVLEKEIAAANTLVRKCFGCQRPPTRKGCAKCPVAKGLDTSRLLHLIWDQDNSEMEAALPK